MPTDIAVTVLGGYLGAGKTTLLNRILAAAPARTAVLVNDFGAVDIDAGLIESDADENGVVSLANGCICCTIADGLVGALDTIRSFEPRPERLVIEASGVGHPGDIATYASLPGFRLDAVVVVADAEQIRSRRDKYVADIVVDQLAAADLLILNKADLVAPETLEPLTAWVRQYAPDATVLAAERGDVPLDVVLGRVPDRPLPAANNVHGDGCGHLDHRDYAGHRHADTIFDTWSCTTDELFDAAALDAALADLPDAIVRVKGIVRTTDTPDRRTIVHAVGPRSERHDGGPWRGDASRLVAIGIAGEVASDWLARHFDVGETLRRDRSGSDFPAPGRRIRPRSG